MTLQPQASEVLSTAQLWIALRYVGAVSSQDDPPEGVNAATLTTAGAGLVERGLLRIGFDGTVQASARLRRIVEPAAFPEAVILVEVAAGPAAAPTESNGATPLVTFAWKAQTLAVNAVTPAGNHMFETYDAAQGVDVLWDKVDGAGIPTRASVAPETPTELPAPLRSVTFTGSTAPGAGPTRRVALAWWVAPDRTFVLRRSSEGPSQTSPIEVTTAQLRASLGGLVAGLLHADPDPSSVPNWPA